MAHVHIHHAWTHYWKAWLDKYHLSAQDTAGLGHRLSAYRDSFRYSFTGILVISHGQLVGKRISILVTELFTQFTVFFHIFSHFYPSGVRALPLGVGRQNIVATLNGV